MAVRRLSKREKYIFLACLLLFFIYLGSGLLLKPLRENTTTLEEKIKASEKRLKNHLRLLQREHAVEETYNKLSSYFKQKASDDQEMTAILSEIESVANEMAVRIADMKPNQVKRVDFYNNFSVNLTIEGDLATATRFLYALQNTPHLFKVDEIYFERSSFKASELRCRLILSKALIS